MTTPSEESDLEALDAALGAFKVGCAKLADDAAEAIEKWRWTREGSASTPEPTTRN